MAASHLFISYRREGGGGHAGRLFDAVARHLGRERVFMDATGIAPGTNFAHSLRAALQQCKAMAVIVTPGWSQVSDANGPRLQRIDDWVRVEIETALAMGVRVVPALVAGAHMPTADALPPSLQAFAESQAVDLRDASWEEDVHRLVNALGLQVRPWRGAAVAAAVAVLALALAVLAASLRDHAAPSGGTGRAAGTDGPLTTLTPTGEQQAALVERYHYADFNALVLRHFLASARERAVPVDKLELDLERFVAAYIKVRKHNFYDDSGITDGRLGQDHDPSPSCDETMRLMRDGEISAAINAFQAGASAALSTRRVNANQHGYAAWCSWLRGQAELLDDAVAPAAAAFDEAIQQSTLAGKDGQLLLFQVMRDSARLARRTGPPALAVRRFEQAVELARPLFAGTQTELMLELADLQDSLRQPAAALQWRERAQQLFDAARDPGDKQAQANARTLAQAYEAGGRRADAQTLRNRYGLPAVP